MKSIALSRATRSLADYAHDLDNDIVVLTEDNKPVAAIVPLRGADRASIALSMHPGFLKLIARSRREFVAGKTLSLAEMRSAVLPPATPAVRPKKRSRR
jgi:antitoxin (DNA-binding transcriptional repressor) of toxin-antitoxin stability system